MVSPKYSLSLTYFASQLLMKQIVPVPSPLSYFLILDMLICTPWHRLGRSYPGASLIGLELTLPFLKTRRTLHSDLSSHKRQSSQISKFNRLRVLNLLVYEPSRTQVLCITLWSTPLKRFFFSKNLFA